MTGYVLRRLLWMVPVLFSVSLVTFGLMHIVPGGPFDQEVSRSPQTVINLNRKYGLDKPLPQQFLKYLSNLVRGDLGISLQFQNRTVVETIRQGIRITGALGLLAFLYSVTLGVSLGVLAALKRNGPLDYVSLFFATAGASVPSFVFAIILVSIFAVHFHWLPVTGWGSWKQAILPTITLGSAPAAFIARITRASMLEVMQQDFIRTARAKGLQERVVVVRHIVKNALIPVLTLLGPLSAGLVTGSFIIEQFFAIPGVGRNYVQAVFARDYGMIMGTTLFYAFIVAFANLIVDLLYGVADPRIRYS
jgi:oligopeptide transport system permease protein